MATVDLEREKESFDSKLIIITRCLFAASDFFSADMIRNQRTCLFRWLIKKKKQLKIPGTDKSDAKTHNIDICNSVRETPIRKSLLKDITHHVIFTQAASRSSKAICFGEYIIWSKLPQLL